MKTCSLWLVSLLALPAAAFAATEQLGVVSFPVSCAPAVQANFVRGVALLHDFWYQESERQFEDIAKSDPSLRDGALGRRDEHLSPNLGSA